MSRIFLSHSHRDAGLASRLRASIVTLGADVFDPSEVLKSGGDFRKSILAAIRRSDAVIALIASPEAAASSWMTYELGMADAAGKEVVVLASKDLATKDLPTDFASWRVIQFDSAQLDRAARAVLERLGISAAA